MSVSIFDLFKIGIGPSSSHTVGPMVAANRFVAALGNSQTFESVAAVRVYLYGSLAMTGKGHATDVAVILGLLGEKPDQVDPAQIDKLVGDAREQKQILLGGERSIAFDPAEQIKFMFGQSLPEHPNGLRFQALDQNGLVCCDQTYFSVGGGFVVDQAQMNQTQTLSDATQVPYPFSSSVELLEQCRRHDLSIADLVIANETSRVSRAEVEEKLLQIWDVMDSSIRRGCAMTGELPGGLKIKRRAHQLYQSLLSQPEASLKDQLTVMDWVNLYALAVNEENAAGGRVVTAPTNGAAGVIPAVVAYYDRFIVGSNKAGIVRFLATAAAVGILYKTNASISAAEVGCQGEIGVACSMAAAGLCAALGGTDEQVENAAEIGMEHNLGLTCDPINGLVQVPCIERNAMGAMKAINAARLALRGTGSHHVSLDSVIATMLQTGLDMQEKYKETALGGLAVNAVAC